MIPPSARFPSPPLLAAAALALATMGLACVPASTTAPLGLDALLAAMNTNAAMARTARGIELALDSNTSITVALPALRALELDVVADAPLLVKWAPYNDGRFHAGPFPRRRPVYPGQASLRFDLSSCADWRADSGLELFVHGTGRLVLTDARTESAPQDPVEFRRLSDRATRWAPENLGHTSINYLSPPYWDASRRSWLPDRMAAGAFALSLLVLLWNRAARRRARPGFALVVGALFAVAGYDAYFLARTLPALQLVPVPDPEVRIRDDYHLAPDVGALAALARLTLRPEDRVGVIGRSDDWFGPQTLCFNLAPRRCVIVQPGKSEHVGIAGVEKLRTEELDALVVTESDARLPGGFGLVAGISARSFVARRR